MTAVAPDPRDVRRAHVLKNGTPAATLTRQDGAVTFRYVENYLASQGRAVATTLPLTDEPLVTRGGAVPAYFANLLPEGRRLTALRRSIKTSVDDEFSLLVAVGSDPVGDVQVVIDPAADATEPPDALSLPVAGLDFAAMSFADLLATHGIGDPSALAGVQEKVSGRMLNVPLTYGGRGHLLKFEVSESPRVVENEAYFLGVARRLRHPVAEARVVHDRDGRAGLLVSRFDRRVTPAGTLERIAVEDGAQLLNLHPADKYAVSMERLAQGVSDVCRSRPLALAAVLRQAVFAWATGNGDLHAKNISTLGSVDREIAPIYDIPSTLAYGDSTFALPLAGRRNNLSRKAFHEFARETGLPISAADMILDEVLDATLGIEDELAHGAVAWDPRRRRDTLRALRRRRRDLAAVTRPGSGG